MPCTTSGYASCPGSQWFNRDKLKRPAVPLLRFLGDAETVTGSRFVVDTPHARILADCGLFQGLKALRLWNWEPFPLAPASIDAILLTHAHLDHMGYVPVLSRVGFRGQIFAAVGTRDLCGIVLPDSGHLQEEDAAYANRKGFSKHAPALPLYTAKEARQVVERFTGVPFDLPVEVAPGLRATFRRAGCEDKRWIAEMKQPYNRATSASFLQLPRLPFHCYTDPMIWCMTEMTACPDT